MLMRIPNRPIIFAGLFTVRISATVTLNFSFDVHTLLTLSLLYHYFFFYFLVFPDS